MFNVTIVTTGPNGQSFGTINIPLAHMSRSMATPHGASETVRDSPPGEPTTVPLSPPEEPRERSRSPHTLRRRSLQDLMKRYQRRMELTVAELRRELREVRLELNQVRVDIRVAHCGSPHV